jgi:hypothetical protein
MAGGARSHGKKRGWLWWSKVLVPAFCVLTLLVIAGSTFLPARLHSGQQVVSSFQGEDVGSYQLPTPTATSTPLPTPTSPPAPTATPHRQPTPPPVGSGSVVGIIQTVFGSYSSAAISVAQCESSLNPAAVNPTSIGGSHASGLFQVLYPSTWDTTSQHASSPFDARANTLAAYEIFQRDGYSWREWSCQP